MKFGTSVEIYKPQNSNDTRKFVIVYRETNGDIIGCEYNNGDMYYVGMKRYLPFGLEWNKAWEEIL